MATSSLLVVLLDQPLWWLPMTGLTCLSVQTPTVSGRGPAQSNGCFSLRATQTALPLEGAVPIFPPFDAPCIFGRDITTYKAFVECWYGNSLKTPPLNHQPMILHFVDSTPTGNSQQVRAVERFIRDLESSTGVKASTISLSQTWLEDGPADAEAVGQTLGEYLKEGAIGSFLYFGYHETQKLHLKYQGKYHRDSFVDPAVQNMWDRAKNVSHT